MAMFTKASKVHRKLRAAFIGVSGGGKTMTALGTMTALVDGGRIAVIDTERSSASLYAEKFAFDTASLTNYSVDSYVAAIDEAAQNGYAGLIIDGLSPAWDGKGGIVELVEETKIRRRFKSDMEAWGAVKEPEDRLWAAILDYPGHIIVTMRVKTAYEITKDDNGKTKVEKLGLAPIQRGNKEYEFDIVATLDRDNNLIIEKTRCEALQGKVFHRAGAQFAGILRNWLDAGAPAVETPPATLDHGAARKALMDAAKAAGIPNARVQRALADYGYESSKDAPLSVLEALIEAVNSGALGNAAPEPATPETTLDPERAAAFERLERLCAERSVPPDALNQLASDMCGGMIGDTSTLETAQIEALCALVADYGHAKAKGRK